MSASSRHPSTEDAAATAACRFILVRPSHPGNIGAAARALKNMGFTDLRIVGPPSLGQHPDAVRMAHGAEDLLGRIQWVDSLQEALAGCHWSLGTTRRLRKPRASTNDLRDLRQRMQDRLLPFPLALVFGPEKDGLGFEDLALCQGSLTIASSPQHPSLNLAQAVLLVAWELSDLSTVRASRTDGNEATHDELEAMFEHLEGMLHDIGFVQPETARHQMLALRGLLSRTVPTRREVTQLRGIWRQATWAARRTRPPANASPADGNATPAGAE
jgi:TrmH family RNA methyltransferase